MSRRRHPLSVLGSCALCTPWCWWLCSDTLFMKVYKMCWCCTLVHYGSGVGLVHLCTRCAGGCAQILLMVVITMLVLCTYVQGTMVVLLRLYHGGSAQASLEWQPPQGPRPSHDPPLFVKSNQKLIYFSSEKYATSNQQNTLTDRTSTESGDNSKYIQQRNGEILLTRNEMDF